MSSLTLSVVMPVYNEAASIDDVIADVTKHILDRVDPAELVIVDDCSTDDTSAHLEALAAADARIRVLRNQTNMGHGRSVRRAMDSATGIWIFHLDSDGQVVPAEFDRLWAHRDDGDLVLGQRITRHDPRHRLILTAVTRGFVSVLAWRRVPDANVPFKLIRRDLYEHLAANMPSTAFAPSILIVLGALRSGAQVREVEITHLARVHGQSTLRLGRLAKAVGRSAVETLRFRVHRQPPYVRR